MKPDFSDARLREMLGYDRETGEGIWLERKKGRKHIAGCVYTRKDGKQYRAICIDYVLYGAHQLFWYHQTGVWPGDDEVDHINGIGTDNRWVNLRLGGPNGNNQNRRITDRNKSGFLGVSWDKSRQKWRAAIRGQTLGRFDTAEEAYETYRKAALERYGEFAHESLKQQDQ